MLIAGGSKCETVSVAWALDLDGVVWLEDHPISGSADAIAKLQDAGEQVGFVTNFSFGRRSEIAEKLERHGIDPGDGVITSSMAVATLIAPGSRVLVCGGPGIVEALEARDVDTIDAGDPAAMGVPVDAVVVGFHRSFDYERMTVAAAAVRNGARLLGTNDDATYPTRNGPIPGGGAILASIATASGVKPEIAGKPHGPIAELVHQLLGRTGIMVGDRPDTDGLFARTLGWEFGLVLSGVTTQEDLPVEPKPDFVANSLAEMVDQALSARDNGR